MLSLFCYMNIATIFAGRDAGFFYARFRRQKIFLRKSKIFLNLRNEYVGDVEHLGRCELNTLVAEN